MTRGERWALRLAVALGASFAALSSATPQTRAPRPALQIFVDTAGVSRVGEDVYVTWIYAKASATAWPSSGILVQFDCRQQQVRRMAHVVFSLKPDGSGVFGQILEDSLPWMPMSRPDMMRLVCATGKAHGTGDAGTAPPTMPPDGMTEGKAAS